VKKLYDHKSKYQHIEVYGNELGKALLLDGVIQLTTGDAHRYHEAMAVVPYLFTQFATRILILGGGDGYAATTLLEYFPVEEITIIEIDPEVVEVGKAFFDFPANEKRVTVKNLDAWEYVLSTPNQYDLILADYTDPSHPFAARLFTVEHFKAINKCLVDKGVFCTQMVAPFANPKAASCLVSTIAKGFEGRTPAPYRIHLPFHPPPAQQGFCMAIPKGATIQLQVPGNLRFINPYNINSIFWLDNDERYTEVPESTESNLLYSQLYQTAYDGNIEEWKA